MAFECSAVLTVSNRIGYVELDAVELVNRALSVSLATHCL